MKTKLLVQWLCDLMFVQHYVNILHLYTCYSETSIQIGRNDFASTKNHQNSILLNNTEQKWS